MPQNRPGETEPDPESPPYAENPAEGPSHRPPAGPAGRAPYLWMGGFAALSFLAWFLDQARWFQATVLEPYGAFLARLTGHWMLLFGMNAHWSGNVIGLDKARFTLSTECTGFLVFMVYAAAVIPFPASARSKLKGLALGFAAVFGLNLLRAFLIVVVGTRYPGTVWSMHMVVGQLLVVTGTFLVFLLWARSARRDDPAGGPPPATPRRALLVRAGWFALGWLAGHTVYYGIFLGSALGEWMRALIVSHASWVLSFFSTTAAKGNALTVSGSMVTLTPGCMASPVVVILTALVFAWPGRWKVKLPVLLIGFLPACYLYTLLRVCAIVLTEPPKGSGPPPFMHSHFGLLLLAAGFAAVLVWRAVVNHQDVPARQHAAAVGFGLLTAAVAALLVDLLVRAGILALTLRLFTGSGAPPVDPDASVTRMMGYMAFIWVLSCAVTPFESLWPEVRRAFAGLAALSALYLAVTLGLGLTGFHPTARMVKALSFLAPVTLYLVLTRCSAFRR